jgi:hypothetical protein
MPNRLKNLRLACCNIGTDFFAVVVTFDPTFSNPVATFGMYFFDVFVTIDTPFVSVFLTTELLLVRLDDLLCFL